MREQKPIVNKPMLNTADALAFLMSAARPVAETELVPTQEANGRVLAEALVSTMNVPDCDNTQMDGYAVRAADCIDGSATLALTQRIPAGHVGQPLLPGCAARIFTGAMIPSGADAVVMQEQCTFMAPDTVSGAAASGAAAAGTSLPGTADAKASTALGTVTIHHAPQPGEWIRRTGEDIRAGNVILACGTRLRSQELGLAASVGLAQLSVRRRLRVAVFFTGDELTMPGQPLAPGAIYNSNRYTLRALLENLGCQITDYGIVPDRLDATREVLRSASEQHDLIITSGGVSVGEEDHIKPAVEAEGHLDMWQIAVKPGKPLAFGQVKQAFFLGLPGNPVSSFITFLLFVRPFILRLQGVESAAALAPKRYAMRADFDWPKGDRRNEFLRAKINPEGGLDLFSNQGSGVLTSTVWGDGLIDNPPGQAIAPGDTVRFIPFGELLA
ncbi:MAG: molybdopterin molybdotransferase [Janthinobacterium sp.]|jgi:molybdopterin molybdotransferase